VQPNNVSNTPQQQRSGCKKLRFATTVAVMINTFARAQRPLQTTHQPTHL
jgi:hypothetical protein